MQCPTLHPVVEVRVHSAEQSGTIPLPAHPNAPQDMVACKYYLNTDFPAPLVNKYPFKVLSNVSKNGKLHEDFCLSCSIKDEIY